MALLAPSLTDFPSANAGEEIVVALSKLKDALEVSIPDSTSIYAMDDVCVILRKKEDLADWKGDRVLAGHWNYEIDEPEKESDLKLNTPKEVLEKYLNMTVMLRYQTNGELGLNTSDPLLLRIIP